MRTIETEEQKKKKKQRNQIIIGSIMVVIMLLSTAGYAFYSTENKTSTRINYNGIRFLLNENGLWSFSIGNYGYATRYNPEDTKNITSPSFDIRTYNGAPLFFVSEDSVSENEILRNLQYFIPRAQPACLEGESCEGNLPIKNCTDNLIIIRAANETRISKQDNCAFIQGQGDELLKASDSFLFKILGVT